MTAHKTTEVQSSKDIDKYVKVQNSRKKLDVCHKIYLPREARDGVFTL